MKAAIPIPAEQKPFQMSAPEAASLQSLSHLDDHSFLERAYMTLLGRAVDPSGLRDYAQRLRSGVSREQVWGEISTSPEAAAYVRRRGAGPRSPEPVREIRCVEDLLTHEGEEFVRQAYRVLLGREADPSGLLHYATRLRQGESREQVIADIWCDAEGQSYGATLPGLPELVRRVQGRKRQGAEVDDLMRLEGDEFTAAACRLVLGRNPDELALQRFRFLLRQGFSRSYVLAELLSCDEATLRPQPSELKEALEKYRKANQPTWTGWFHRAVLGVESDMPAERRERAILAHVKHLDANQ